MGLPEPAETGVAGGILLGLLYFAGEYIIYLYLLGQYLFYSHSLRPVCALLCLLRLLFLLCQLLLYIPGCDGRSSEECHPSHAAGRYE